MKVFSNSKIKTYEQCPRKFKLQYIDKIQIPKGAMNVEALLGTCVHDTLRELYQQTNDGKLVQLSSLQSLFSNQWNSNVQKDVIIPKKGLTLEYFEQKGWEMIEKYFNHYSPFKDSQTIALEKKVQFPLGEFEITGYIDRLSIREDHTFEIHDYKTSSAYPTLVDIENDTQLTLYQIGLSSLFQKVDKVKLIWHFLQFDQELSVLRTEEEIEQTKQKTLSGIRRILHDPYYSPIETPLCNWCLFEEFCPAKTHNSNLLTYSSSELDSGVQIVDEYVKIQNQITEINTKKALLENVLTEIEKRAIEFSTEKNYSTLVGKQGSLQIKDDWDYQFPKSTDPDRIELENWIKTKNLWNDVSILQLTKLSKLIKNEEFPEEIHNELMGFSQMIHTKKVKLIKNKSNSSLDELSENE